MTLLYDDIILLADAVLRIGVNEVLVFHPVEPVFKGGRKKKSAKVNLKCQHQCQKAWVKVTHNYFA